jgi:copper chaperone
LVLSFQKRPDRNRKGGVEMEKSIIKVEGMSCEHCARAIREAVGVLPGVTGVIVDLSSKTATVEHNPETAALDKIKREIEEQGYSVVS